MCVCGCVHAYVFVLVCAAFLERILARALVRACWLTLPRADVYNRASKWPTLAAFLVSAMWHGFYPGYYVAFVTSSVFVEAARAVRRSITPAFERGGKLAALARPYALLANAVCMVSFSYVCGAFQLLDAARAYNLYRSLYFVPVISTLSATLLVPLVAPLFRPLHPPHAHRNHHQQHHLKQAQPAQQ